MDILLRFVPISRPGKPFPFSLVLWVLLAEFPAAYVLNTEPHVSHPRYSQGIALFPHCISMTLRLPIVVSALSRTHLDVDWTLSRSLPLACTERIQDNTLIALARIPSLISHLSEINSTSI